MLKKTAPVIFKHKNKKLEFPIKIKLGRKRLYPYTSVKCLCVEMDENLNRKDQTHNVAAKLNKAFALFCKSRNYVSFNTLKTIHFATLFTYKLCKPYMGAKP